MKTINKIAAFAAVAVVMMLGSGCQKEPMPQMADETIDRPTPPPTDGEVYSAIALKIKGVNAGRYGALNMSVQGIAIKTVDQRTGAQIWTTRRFDARTLNVLQDRPALIQRLSVPSGYITEVKLFVARGGNSLVWGDRDGRHLVTLHLTNPTPSTIGRRLVRPGKINMVDLELNVLQSLEVEKKDQYLFSPVLVLKSDGIGPDTEVDPQ